MIPAPLPRALPSRSGRLSMIIPPYYGLIITNWRASEASETLSGLFNRESRIYILYYTRNVLLSAQMGERASVVLICIITSRYNEVK